MPLKIDGNLELAGFNSLDGLINLGNIVIRSGTGTATTYTSGASGLESHTIDVTGNNNFQYDYIQNKIDGTIKLESGINFFLNSLVLESYKNSSASMMPISGADTYKIDCLKNTRAEFTNIQSMNASDGIPIWAINSDDLGQNKNILFNYRDQEDKFDNIRDIEIWKNLIFVLEQNGELKVYKDNLDNKEDIILTTGTTLADYQENSGDIISRIRVTNDKLIIKFDSCAKDGMRHDKILVDTAGLKEDITLSVTTSGEDEPYRTYSTLKWDNHPVIIINLETLRETGFITDLNFNSDYAYFLGNNNLIEFNLTTDSDKKLKVNVYTNTDTAEYVVDFYLSNLVLSSIQDVEWDYIKEIFQKKQTPEEFVVFFMKTSEKYKQKVFAKQVKIDITNSKIYPAPVVVEIKKIDPVSSEIKDSKSYKDLEVNDIKIIQISDSFFALLNFEKYHKIKLIKELLLDNLSYNNKYELHDTFVKELTHSAGVNFQDYFYVYGGLDIDNHNTNGFYMYAPNQKLTLELNPTCTSDTSGASGAPLPNRFGHGVINLEKNDLTYMYMWGGHGQQTGSVLEYSYHDNTFTMTPTTTAASPTTRNDFVIFKDTEQNIMYIYGGIDVGDVHYSDMWKYEPIYQVWTQVTPTNIGPNTIYAAYFTQINDTEVFVFGGRDINDNNTQTAYIYSTTQNTWYELSTLNKPSPRSGGVCWYDSSRNTAYIFGGQTDEGYTDDIYSLDLGTMIWKKLDTTNEISGRSFSMLLLTSENLIYLFCGEDNDTVYNEIYLLSMPYVPMLLPDLLEKYYKDNVYEIVENLSEDDRILIMHEAYFKDLTDTVIVAQSLVLPKEGTPPFYISASDKNRAYAFDIDKDDVVDNAYELEDNTSFDLRKSPIYIEAS